MNTAVLGRLQQLGLLTPERSAVLERQLDPAVATEWARDQNTRALRAALSAQEKRVVANVVRRQSPVSEAEMQEMWGPEDDRLWAAVQPNFEAVAREQAARLTGVLQAGSSATFDLVDDEIINWVAQYYTSADPRDFGSIPNLNLTSRQAFAQVFLDWQLGGLPGRPLGLPQLIQNLRPVFGASRAKVIGVTETTRISAETMRRVEQKNRFTVAYRYITANDGERVCPLCGPAHNTVTDKDSGTFPDGLGYPPRHPNCLLPGTLVAPIGPLHAVTKAFYHGPCVEITLRSGSRLSVTENHPVLTPDGFVKAKVLRKGDNVVYASDAERMLQSINPHSHYRPTAIEEVYRAAKKQLFVVPSSVPRAPEQFYGDGRFFNGNVEIVPVNSELLGNLESSTTQAVGSISFNRRGMGHGLLLAPRSEPVFVVRDTSTSRSEVGLCEECGTLLGSGVSPADSHSFRLSSQRDTRLDDLSTYDSPTHTRLSSEFLLRFSGEIALQQIVEIRHFFFSDHVYDLQSSMYELYTGNGIIVKNCRCVIVPETENSLRVNPGGPVNVIPPPVPAAPPAPVQVVAPPAPTPPPPIVPPAPVAPVPPAPVAPVPPAPAPSWRPSMTRAEAEAWAANSQVPETVFHMTAGVAAERSIKANGFDLGRRNFGRVWGDGVYVTPKEEVAKQYGKWVGPAARKLEIKLNVTNVFVYKPTGPHFGASTIIREALGVPTAEINRLERLYTLDKILSDAGYDGLHIAMDDFDIGVGGNQMVIFDPKKVTVIDG